MFALKGDVFNHLTQLANLGFSRFHPAPIVDEDQMEVVPVQAVSGAARLPLERLTKPVDVVRDARTTLPPDSTSTGSGMNAEY